MFVTNEVADCFSEHGGNDQGVYETNDTEDGNVKRDQGREKEDHARGKNRSADHTIEFFDFLNEAVRDDEADVSERKHCCAGNKLPVDENVTEKCEEKTCHHGNIEFHVGCFRFAGINEIDRTEDGKERAASTFQHTNEIKILIKKVHNTDDSNHDQVDRQHVFLGLVHCSPHKYDVL